MNRSFNRFVITLTIALALAPLLGACASAPQPVTHLISPLASVPTPPLDQLQWILADLNTGAVLEEHGADELGVPASASKLFTARAALDILGPKYQFKTDILRSGGDLILRGSGDPTLSVTALMELVLHLRDAGIVTVQGKFIYDDSALGAEDRLSPLAGWDGERFNPGVSALTCEFNRAQARWLSTEDPTERVFYLVPQLSRVAEPILRVESPFGGGYETLLVPNSLSAEGREGIPVRDPSLWTARLLREMAQQVGVQLPEPIRGITPAKAQSIANWKSAPVTDLVGGMLEYSNNLTAELLMMSAMTKWTRHPCTISECARALTQWTTHHLPTDLKSGLALANGSGLSLDSRASPRQLAAWVRSFATTHWGQRQGLTLMPISGIKGSLRNRLDRPSTALRVWAKTGTLDSVNTLVGVLGATRLQPARSFAIFAPGGETGKKQIEALIESWVQ